MKWKCVLFLLAVSLKLEAQFTMIHDGSNHRTITKFIPTTTCLSFSDDASISEINLQNDSIHLVYDFQAAGCNQANYYRFNNDVTYFRNHASCQFNAIYKSVNNMVSWQTVLSNSNDQQQLVMFNDTDGILTDQSNYVLRTSDGCLSFDTLFQPEMILATDAAVYSDSSLAFFSYNRFYYSRNRGISWSSFQLEPDTRIYTTNFLNEDSFYVAGKLFSSTNPDTAHTKIIFSHNHGASFDSLFLPIGAHIIYDIAFIGNQEAYAVAYSLPTQKNVVIKTTDLFNTAEVIETPYAAPNYLLQKIHFVNDSIAYLGGYYGELVKWNKNHSNVGIKKVEALHQALPNFSVFPNPASNTLNLQCQEAIRVVEVYNAQGALVTKLENLPMTSQVPISITDWNTGSYWLKVTTQQGKSFVKPVSVWK